MINYDIRRRLAAELFGTMLLLMTVVGSGIMAENLSGGNDALSLLGNTIPTGCILVVLIIIFGPVSGAHFNPAVTLIFYLRNNLKVGAALAYMAVQIIGGLLGTVAAHFMFEEPLIQFSEKIRSGPSHWFSEFVAAFGLIATILGTLRWKPEAIAWTVGLFITAGYWFTASTSFANPAVTIARTITNTFSGIAPENMPAFILAQFLGAIMATIFFKWLLFSKNN